MKFSKRILIIFLIGIILNAGLINDFKTDTYATTKVMLADIPMGSYLRLNNIIFQNIGTNRILSYNADSYMQFGPSNDWNSSYIKNYLDKPQTDSTGYLYKLGIDARFISGSPTLLTYNEAGSLPIPNYRNYNWWTQTGYNDYQVFFVSTTGTMTHYDHSRPDACTSSFYVRPTMYLKNGLFIISGDGTSSNPYILSNNNSPNIAITTPTENVTFSKLYKSRKEIA